MYFEFNFIYMSMIFIGLIFVIFHKIIGKYSVSFKRSIGTNLSDNAEDISKYVYCVLGIIFLLIGLSHVIHLK